MKKHFYAMLLASALCIPLLAACGDDNPDNPSDTPVNPDTPENPDTPDSPDSPAAEGTIRRILCYEQDGSGEDFLGEEYHFSYDGQGRLTEIKLIEHDEEISGRAAFMRHRATKTRASRGIVDSESVCRITYGNGTVSYDMVVMDGKDIDYKVVSTARLDAQGRVISGTVTETEYTEDGNPDETETETYTLAYNADGYLIRSEITDDTTNFPENLTWKGNNLTSISFDYMGMAVVETAAYGSVPNKTSLDLNMMIGYMNIEGFPFCVGDEKRIFGMIGLTGKRSANLVEKITSSYYSTGTVYYAFKYDVNAAGFPTRMISSSMGMGENYITYRYEIAY